MNLVAEGLNTTNCDTFMPRFDKMSLLQKIHNYSNDTYLSMFFSVHRIHFRGFD